MWHSGYYIFISIIMYYHQWNVNKMCIATAHVIKLHFVFYLDYCQVICFEPGFLKNRIDCDCDLNWKYVLKEIVKKPEHLLVTDLSRSQVQLWGWLHLFINLRQLFDSLICQTHRSRIIPVMVQTNIQQIRVCRYLIGKYITLHEGHSSSSSSSVMKLSYRLNAFDGPACVGDLISIRCSTVTKWH